MNINMLLTVVGVMMLGVFMLSANYLMSDNTRISDENEYAITAIALAQSVLDEAKTKAFDASTASGSISSPSQLTGAGSLGPGSHEYIVRPDTLRPAGFLSTTRYDDVDDYNGYTRRVDTPRADKYLVSVAVNYASPTYPDSSRSTQTYCKRMVVTVTNPFLSHPVRLSYAFFY